MIPAEWRLFIDSSKRSVKAVLLHNGNKYSRVPVGHSVHLTENYENMKILLNAIKYSEYQREICGDLKVVGILGMQKGFTKYCCFLCLWDSRATKEHYVKTDWPYVNISYQEKKALAMRLVCCQKKSYYHPFISSLVL
ncbi:hypothetical protein PoB_005660300 [Plakobranchus ocellatus]|uniref:Uncharacterized protein n=1 Tax=Plakobranchus ocellatus TaxID=259542 RepID=A0AAV4CDV2_9GAST|nr:hypothetical protein PoB_005660300 [Plakobranchus ocellatus]